MSVLQSKIDFAVIFSVTNANPNGDPLNGNRPRQNYDGLGEVSDVAIKRKIRNRLQDMGEVVFVQSADNTKDGCQSLHERFNKLLKAYPTVIALTEQAQKACEVWFDVRAFGQVFAFKKGAGKKKKAEEEDGNGDGDSNSISIGIRGPVTIQSAFSVEPVDISSMQITKSVNLEPENPPEKKGSDTMGMKHRVDKGIYVAYGAINTQLAEKTGFSDEDAEKIKEALRTLFKNDASSARPEGSMEVLKLVWWKHSNKTGQYSSAKVHHSLHDVMPDGSYSLDELPDLIAEEIEGE